MLHKALASTFAASALCYIFGTVGELFSSTVLYGQDGWDLLVNVTRETLGSILVLFALYNNAMHLLWKLISSALDDYNLVYINHPYQ